MRQTLFTPFTPFVNVTGPPAASVPLHWSEDGLPVGVQLIGKPFADATVIRLAAQLEQARPWADRAHPCASGLTGNVARFPGCEHQAMQGRRERS